MFNCINKSIANSIMQNFRIRKFYFLHLLAAAFFIFSSNQIYAEPVILIKPFTSNDSDKAQIGHAISAQIAYYLNHIEKINIMPDFRRRMYSRLIMSNGMDRNSIESLRSYGISIIISGEFEIINNNIIIKPEIIFLNSNNKKTLADVRGSKEKIGSLVFKVFINITNYLQKNEIFINEKQGSSQSLFNSLTPLFQADFSVFDLLGRGIMIESDDPQEAYKLYKKAQKNSYYYFTLNDRVFHSYYVPYNAYRYKYLYYELSSYEKQRNSVMQDDLINHSVMLSELGTSYRRIGMFGPSLNFLEQSNIFLVQTGRISSLHYAENLVSMGESLIDLEKFTQAHSNFTLAIDMADMPEKENPLFFVRCRIGLANSVAGIGSSRLSLKHYKAAIKTLTDLMLDKSLLMANALANYSLVLYNIGDFQESSLNARKAVSILDSLDLANSLMAATVVNILAASEISSGKYEYALKILKVNEAVLNLTGNIKSQVYGDTVYNIAVSYFLSKKDIDAKRYFKIAADTYNSIGHRKNYIRAKAMTGTVQLDYNFFSLASLPSNGSLGLSAEEDSQLQSYTGVYNYKRHIQRVRSRTYPGRHDDTNIFLKDLFSGTSARSMNDIRSVFLNGNSDIKGKNVVFIDIGPAIANSANPGVTAVTLAEDFPSMQVIGLDLPEQVDIFLTKIDQDKVENVRSYKNLFILSGDGTLPLLDQIQNGNWAWKDRKKPVIDKRAPVVIRMANSIDIYFSWNINRKVLNDIASDFETNPVLIFFNRSILYKASGSNKFKMIGYVSVRGFWHQDELLDRLGEAPYTLIDRSDIIEVNQKKNTQ